MQLALWRRYGGCIVLALALAISGCSGDEDLNLTGTWTGTIQDSVAGAGALLLTMSQTGNQVSGTWQSTFPDPANNNGGTLSGTVDDPSIALLLTSTLPQACSFTVAATLDDDDDNFSGTYTAFNCARPTSGSLDVTRR